MNSNTLNARRATASCRHRLEIWLAMLGFCGAVGAPAAAPAQSPVPSTDARRVLLVTGIDYPGHHWRETAPEVKRALESDPRLRVHVTDNPDSLSSLRAGDWDAIVLHFMNWEKPAPGEAARRNLLQFVQSGKGLVLLHFACGAWQDWPEFKQLAGRVWDPKLRGHDPHGTFRVEIVDPQHPITKGLEPFETTDELYTCLAGETPIHVVATARSKVDSKEYPMAFVLNYGQGRVFHTVLGHDVLAMTNSSVPELLRRGCAWVSGLPVRAEAFSERPVMTARTDPSSGQVELSEGSSRILRYNYRTIEPGDLLAKVHPDNRKYARARSDYIHPLYGPSGEELTKDWPVDHPHHRGIYWAWPEVEYRGERGDLHALQRVFARPTGKCLLRGQSNFAEVEAENDWLWDDREPIVRERTLIRAYRANAFGRALDLEFQFRALQDGVTVARRGTDLYGGLDIRLAAVADQQITLHTDPPATTPRMAWADLSGVFASGAPPAGLTIFQHPGNPDYPGDWVKFPEINWLQPTFPVAKTRYTLKKDEPLVLRFRLWIHPHGTPTEEACAEQWRQFRASLPETR